MVIKKGLVPINIDKPNIKINGFLYPNIDDEINSFKEIKTNSEWNVGMVVYTGKEITENDLFKSIIDAGTKIESVSKLINSLKPYTEQLNKLKIGDYIKIIPLQTNPYFKLIRLDKPKSKKRIFGGIFN